MTEAEALLARLAAEESIDRDEATRLLRALRGAARDARHAALADPAAARRRAPQQRAQRPRGPLWNDWEDTCLGPVGWDAACLMPRRARRHERAAGGLAASGMRLDPAELALWVEARAAPGRRLAARSWLAS